MRSIYALDVPEFGRRGRSGWEGSLFRFLPLFGGWLGGGRGVVVPYFS